MDKKNSQTCPLSLVAVLVLLLVLQYGLPLGLGYLAGAKWQWVDNALGWHVGVEYVLQF